MKDLTLHNRRHQLLAQIREANADLDDVARARKYAAMAESPYRFFRGTSHLFWADLYRDWRFAFYGGVPGTQTWIQGDAHVYNFGAFANHEGEVIFGLDDFDDGIVSDYQYDLWRLAVSMVLDARENDQLDADAIDEGLAEMVSAYRKTATHYQPDDPDREVHFTAGTTGKPLRPFLEKVGSKKTRSKMLGKWTRLQKNGRRVFDTEHHKLKRLSPQQRKAFMTAFEAYRQRIVDAEAAPDDTSFFKVKDVVRRIKAGTGSLGTPRYYVLIEGDHEGQNDDVILDVKRQDGPAALAAMTAEERAAYDSVFEHEGQRHAEAFHAMAEHPDRYLGWLLLDDGAYSVRERSPFKKDFPTDSLDKPKRYRKMAATWGHILATEHKRASRALNPDVPFRFEDTLAEVIGSDKKGFVRLTTTIARQYADCVTQDYQWFCDAGE
ncbi:DUF2252 domain-containing protein [Tamilnaduibacter salinus]|uniref:DUF2252 domain-containing protein n=1 Tax=Tamilnaduibacter salinus TaxID=1484056 RepID=UPI001FB02245|nr:DUF2252 family protein [Tamilnaduibacter salinus]